MKFPAESQRKSGISARMYGLMVVMCVAMQAPAQEPSIGTTEADPICKGWLLELLDGDIEAARESYRIAAEGEDSTHLQRTLAQARLLEIARLGGHTQLVSHFLRDSIPSPTPCNPYAHRSGPGQTPSQPQNSPPIPSGCWQI